ncbi:MAG: hypothetical protein O6757_12170 [Alphaproteobacteria bacterium]|nr:hypothetical protein [Alphaproteobacteria bacterium]
MSENNSVSDEQLSRYIGEIARNWSIHEHLMAAMYQTIPRISYNDAMTICFALSPPQRRDLLAALTEPKISDQTLLSEFKAYLKEYDDVKKLRNDAVHGLWSSVPAFDTPLLTLVKSRATATMNFARPDRSWFEDIISRLSALHGRATDLNERIFRAIASP